MPISPVVRPKIPKSNGQISNPIDAFVLAKLRDSGLSLSPEADRRTLIRRATFDLHGLPPTPEEVAAFVDDPAPDAYEKLIDRLLASPRYGERWARYWLDAVGYSDSEGKVEADELRPQAWRYRDYVIRSLNSDKPYDQFLREQIAGDEMVAWQGRKEVDAGELEKLVATGFWRMAPDGTYSPPQSFIPERMNVIADQMEVFGSGTVARSVA